jgi:glycerol-3-phosphate acyltransferase PlsY
LLVFLTELAKGVLAVAVPQAYDSGELIVGLTVVAVVIGIRWPVWLGFKGGRANTAGMAAVLLISWQAMLSLTVVWILARVLTRNSFKATRITFVLMPVILGIITRSWWFTLTALALLIIYLTMQRPDSDDHLLLKERWESLWGFLTSPPRKG